MSSFSCLRALMSNGALQKPALSPIVQQVRHRKYPIIPKIQNPIWFARKERATFDQELTKENQAFVKEMVHARYGPPAIIQGVETFAQPSALQEEPIKYGQWSPGVRRTGLIARKIGVYPLWTKDGRKITTTLLQVVDNHVINYIPPELYESPRKAPRVYKNLNKWGALVVGAERRDPQEFTKEYCGIFKESGVPPTKLLTRFLISPEARLQPGTPLSALHFQVGDYIDAFGLTKFRGFQGVMKRWGFHGMPRSHGVTKTHRRGGNIGHGGNKARVWPGTKMPGFMGDRRRTLRGVKIVRINTKYNVIYVLGQSVPGGMNGVVYLHDTILPLKWHKEKGPANFPTFMPSQLDETGLPEDIFEDSIHQFAEPSITFVDDEVKDPKKK